MKKQNIPTSHEIRLSERRFYQKVTDIYATALDYDKTSKSLTISLQAFKKIALGYSPTHCRRIDFQELSKEIKVKLLNIPVLDVIING